MPEWRKATSKDRKDRRRREDIDRAAARRPRSRPDISGWRPEQEVLFTNGKGLVVDRNDRDVIYGFRCVLATEPENKADKQ